MTSNMVAGKFKQFRGEIRKQWGKLTDDDIDRAQGSWEKFVGTLQEKYGKSRNEADEEAKRFFDDLA